MANKSDNATVIERTEEVYKLLIRGYRRFQIIQYASNWKLTDRQIDTYISKANDRLEEESSVVRGKELGKAIANLNELYKKSFEEGNYKDCKDIQKEMNSLLGLAEAVKLDIKADVKVAPKYNMSKFTAKQLENFHELAQIAQGADE